MWGMGGAVDAGMRVMLCVWEGDRGEQAGYVGWDGNGRGRLTGDGGWKGGSCVLPA